MKTIMRLVPILLIPLFASAASGQEVKAKYISSSGSQIKIQLTIRQPAPQNIIIEQYLPAGTKVVSSTPKAKQRNSSSGVVKWLLKGLKPGKRVIVMKVAPPLSDKASGRLTYRNPGDGRLIEKRF